jgi:hypothetical protein
MHRLSVSGYVQMSASQEAKSAESLIIHATATVGRPAATPLREVVQGTFL